MTWGNRAHRQNTKLYTGFTKAAFRILHSGGILILVDGRIGRRIADPPGYTTNQTGCEFSERQRNGDGWGFVYEKRRENPKNALISRYSMQYKREIVKEVVTL